MADLVSNVIYVKGERERLNEMIEFVKGDELAFDFNKIIPMPKELKISSGTVSDRALEIVEFEEKKLTSVSDKAIRDYQNALKCFPEGPLSADLKYLFNEEACCPKTIEDARYLGKIMQDNLEKHQAKNWFHWRSIHWGTKWNAYEVEIQFTGEDEARIRFITAWYFPRKVIEELISRFPELEWAGLYSNEQEYSDYHLAWAFTEGRLEEITDADKEEVFSACWDENWEQQGD